MSNSITNRLRKNFLYELILRKIRLIHQPDLTGIKLSKTQN